MELDVLTEAIDQLMGADPATCIDAESIETLQHQLARLEAFAASTAAAFDCSGSGSTMAPEQQRRGSLPGAASREARPGGWVRRGRVLRQLPACAEAWSEGSISAAHVYAIASVRRESTEDALRRDEELLVQQTQTLRFDSFAHAVAYWEQLADPDGSEDSQERRRNQRDVYLSNTFQWDVGGQDHPRSLVGRHRGR